jgi:hypothetical protein
MANGSHAASHLSVTISGLSFELKGELRPGRLPRKNSQYEGKVGGEGCEAPLRRLPPILRIGYGETGGRLPPLSRPCEEQTSVAETYII